MWYTFAMESAETAEFPEASSIDQVRLDKTAFEVFSSFEKAEAADRAYWHSRTPEERLLAIELMRQSAYGYDPATARLQRVLEFAQLKQG
jgi:hypothetical protein